MTQSNTNAEQNEVEVEFIGAGEESNAEKRMKDESMMSESEKLAKKMVEGFDGALDEKLDELGINTDEVEGGFVDINELQSQFDSIIEQSTDHSTKIAESIKVSDLGENGSNLLMDGYKAIEKISMDKSFAERAISKIPVKMIRNKLEEGFKVAELESKRNASVKDYAQSHFDALNKQKEHVNSNRISVDEIRNKLEDSSDLLEGMLGDARKGLAHLNKIGASKAQEIKGKELMVNIGTQIKAQRVIVEQAEMFESVASIVSEKITSTLPQIKDQFINQVSVTASLKNLANLQKSVESTKDMVLKMQNEVLDQANDVYDVYQKTGLGESKEQKALAKSADDKMKLLRTKRNNISEQYNREVEEKFKELDKELLDGKKYIGNQNK